MNISSITTSTAIDMGDLLKDINDISNQFQDKLINVNIKEELIDENLGQTINMMA